jgi:hypothetical protein
VKLVRDTEQQLLALGQPITRLGQPAQHRLVQATALSDATRERFARALDAALSAHQRIRPPSVRLTHGQKLPHGKLVKAYDLTLAPIMQGKSNCPAQFGRKPGIASDPAPGFLCAHRVPEGNPRDVSSVLPLRDKVERAIERVKTVPRLHIYSVAGALGGNDATLRQALQARGILTVGIPKTVAPIQTHPSPQEVLDILNEAGLNRKRTPHHVPLACACGFSRPVVESHSASVLSRGAGQGRYKGLPGAVVQQGMTVMAHTSATIVRIRQQQLSKRAQKFRRLLGLRCHNVNQINNSKKLVTTI